MDPMKKDKHKKDFEKAKKISLILILVASILLAIFPLILEQGEYREDSMVDVFFYMLLVVSLSEFVAIRVTYMSSFTQGKTPANASFFARVMILFALSTAVSIYAIVFYLFSWDTTHVFDMRAYVFIPISIMAWMYVSSLKEKILKHSLN